MNVNTQLLGLIKDMSQEQQALLCEILLHPKNNVIFSVSLLLESVNLVKSKSTLTNSMLRLVLECHENNVNPSTVFDTITPLFLFLDQAPN